MTRSKPRLTIATLLTQGQLTQQQIAEKTGCSRATVARVAREIRVEMSREPSLRSEYQALLEESLPSATRASRYKELASQSEQPMVALKALERVDDLVGITTEKDRLRAPLPEAPQDHRPMFILMGGATVQLVDTRRERVVNPKDEETLKLDE